MSLPDEILLRILSNLSFPELFSLFSIPSRHLHILLPQCIFHRLRITHSQLHLVPCRAQTRASLVPYRFLDANTIEFRPDNDTARWVEGSSGLFKVVIDVADPMPLPSIIIYPSLAYEGFHGKYRECDERTYLLREPYAGDDSVMVCLIASPSEVDVQLKWWKVAWVRVSLERLRAAYRNNGTIRTEQCYALYSHRILPEGCDPYSSDALRYRLKDYEPSPPVMPLETSCLRRRIDHALVAHGVRPGVMWKYGQVRRLNIYDSVEPEDLPLGMLIDRIVGSERDWTNIQQKVMEERMETRKPAATKRTGRFAA